MFEKPGKYRATLIGGLVIGLVTGLPLINILNRCCCCGIVLLCGMASLYIYKQEFTDEMAPLESSDALILGILAGIAGAFIGTAVLVLSRFIFGPVDEKLLLKVLQRVQEQGSLTPEMSDFVSDKLIKTLEKSIEDGVNIGDILSELLFGIILYPIFSMLGGLIGFGIFGKKKPGAPFPTHPV
jgi:hypothetical protein